MILKRPTTIRVRTCMKPPAWEKTQGYRYGEWGATLMLLGNLKTVDEDDDEVWQVTHLPSGLGVRRTYCLSERDARAIAARLADRLASVGRVTSTRRLPTDYAYIVDAIIAEALDPELLP